MASRKQSDAIDKYNAAQMKKPAVHPDQLKAGLCETVMSLVKCAPRDMHGVFYDAQELCQDIAEVLGMPAPDRVPETEVPRNVARTDVLTEKELEAEHRGLAPAELSAITAGAFVEAVKLVRDRTKRTLQQSHQIVMSFRDLLRGKK